MVRRLVSKLHLLEFDPTNTWSRLLAPGGDPRQLYLSLTQKLAHVPDSAILYPGHLYAPQPSAELGATRKSNFVFKPKSEAEWMQMFGGGG